MARTTLLVFGLILGVSAPAMGHWQPWATAFFHFPGDHSYANGYMPHELQERCVAISTQMGHGSTGRGRSWMKWTTSSNIAYLQHCDYNYRLFQAQWWRTNVFVTVQLTQPDRPVWQPCTAKSDYRSGVYTGEFAYNWTASDLSRCGPGIYITRAQIQAYDPSIWPGGWSPPVSYISAPHRLPTTPA